MADVVHEHYDPSDELEGIETDPALISLAILRMRAQRNSAIWLDATNSLVTDTYSTVELLECVCGCRRYYPLPGFKGEVKTTAPKVISSLNMNGRYTSLVWFDTSAKKMTCIEPKDNWPVVSGDGSGIVKATYFLSFNPTTDGDITIFEHDKIAGILIKDSKIQIKVG